MTHELDLHPEELLDRARHGVLSNPERTRLDAHLAACATCRIELTLREDFASERSRGDDDDALLARVLDDFERAPRSPSTAPTGPKRRRWVAALLAAAALAGIATAATLAYVRAPASEPPPAAPPAETAAPQPAPKPAPAPRAPPTATSPVPEPIAPAKPVVSAARPATVKPTAAELFARANTARRSGAIDAALTNYDQLSREYPGSREALTSRVAVGRLLLDARGDAAGALREFDAYLSRSPGGTLAEEALAGRAVSHQRLGQVAAERAAWSQLLQRYPNTVHRARAEQRLAGP